MTHIKKVEPEQSADRVQLPVNLINCEPPTGVAQVYSNYYELSWTAYDVQIRLSHLQRVPEVQPTNRIEHRATVTVAWSQLKALTTSLAELVTAYEKLNGTIEPANMPSS